MCMYVYVHVCAVVWRSELEASFVVLTNRAEEGSGSMPGAECWACRAAYGVGVGVGSGAGIDTSVSVGPCVSLSFSTGIECYIFVLV